MVLKELKVESVSDSFGVDDVSEVEALVTEVSVCISEILVVLVKIFDSSELDEDSSVSGHQVV